MTSLWLPGGEPSGGSITDLTAPAAIDPVALVSGSTALTSTALGSWSAAVTVTASGTDDTGSPAPSLVLSGSGAGPYSATIASGLVSGRTYTYDIEGDDGAGQIARTSLTVSVASSGGGITAPGSVLSIDYTDEASADWSADSGTSRTVDTYSLSSYAGGASTYGPDGSTGIVMETSDASTGTILGTGLVIDISGEAAQDRFVVITQKWTGIDLPAADDYLVFEALGRLSPSVRGPGGGIWLLGDGKVYATARRAGNDAPLSALATTLGAVPSTFWTRLVIDRITGAVRSYYSTTAPSSSSLSGGMTLAGYARQSASDSVSTTAPDVWPSNWLIQARIYRGTTDGGTTLTATLATLDIEELTP